MKKIKIRIGIFLAIILASLICTSVWGQTIKIKIENKTAQIKSNKEVVTQIQYAKEQLHNTANALRQEHIYDEDFVFVLGNKWSELDVQEKESRRQIVQLEKEVKELEKKTIKTTSVSAQSITSAGDKKFLGTFEATAYCITGKTASGTHTTANRTIAVDPKVIPLGAKVYVEGYGTYIAEDTGGAVKGKIIDIYIPGYQNCINFGRRKVNVYLVD